MRAMTAPTATVSPSPTSCSLSTPAIGDGTSTLTLSVSRLAIGSSAATASPGFFNHCPRVPSVIDFPSAGTATTVATSVPLFRSDGRAGWAGMAQSGRDQGCLLGCMALGEAGGRRGAGVAARILRTQPAMSRVREALFEEVLDEEPGAIVLRLLLRPDQLLKPGHRL